MKQAAVRARPAPGECFRNNIFSLSIKRVSHIKYKSGLTYYLMVIFICYRETCSIQNFGDSKSTNLWKTAIPWSHASSVGHLGSDLTDRHRCAHWQSLYSTCGNGLITGYSDVTEDSCTDSVTWHNLYLATKWLPFREAPIYHELVDFESTKFWISWSLCEMNIATK